MTKILYKCTVHSLPVLTMNGRVMRLGIGYVSSALLCLQVLAITTTVHSQLTPGAPG